MNNKVLTWPLSQPLLKPQPPFSVNIKLKVNQQKLLHFSMEKDPCENYITWPNGICFWLENLKILLKTYKHWNWWKKCTSDNFVIRIKIHNIDSSTSGKDTYSFANVFSLMISRVISYSHG